ncbi:ankyrin repeat domain-containing protein 50-like [Haliotis asinina]|uniref:ankyrin repeat domain-containing protein 50-like n=1 Tax=Haliotis asinina TaxID=109174 RepID=UPI00353266A2
MSDSEMSSLSSTYSSDGPYRMSYCRSYDSSSDSDQSAGISDDALPSDVLSLSEQQVMLRTLHADSAKPSIGIFPTGARRHLSSVYPEISERLTELLQDDNAVILAGSCVRSMAGRKHVRVPKNVICDVCVFSIAHPVMILTFTTTATKPEKAVGYNSDLARSVIRTVVDEMHLDFSVVHGVVDEDMWQTRDAFFDRIDCLENMYQAMNSLSVPTEIMSTILELFFGHLQDNQLPQQSDREDEEEEHIETESAKQYEASTTTTSSITSSLTTAGQRSHISSSLERPVPDKHPQVESLATGVNVSHHAPIQRSEYDVLLKRIEQLEQTHEGKLQKRLHQEYLTDVRLSLLMRPRSSLFSDSGYSTSTSTGDRGRNADARIEEKHLSYKNEVDKRPLLPNTKKDVGDLELIKYNREATLHEACLEGRLDAVTHIVSGGLADVNCRDWQGRTPLMVAARGGHLSIVNVLIRYGCYVSEVDDYNDTALHAACMSRNVDVVKCILSQNPINMEKKGRYGWTPVMRAANKGHRELFNFLVSKGCDLSFVDTDTNNILHVACLGGNVDICEYLLSNDIVGIESRGQHNRTPVMLAANRGHKELFDFLVSKGCDLSTVDGDGNNILHVACIGGNVDISEYLISNNIVGIESRGQDNMTPVMLAANRGHKELFDFLVSKGCDLLIVDGRGDNILHTACIGGSVDICKYLLSNDKAGIETRGQYNYTPVMVAANKGHRELFDVFVSRGCDLSVVDGNGNNILHVACLGGNVDICKYLLSKDKVAIECRGKYNWTPVMRAANKGHRELFNFLVSKGCDLAVVDGVGNNILHVACLGGNVDICKYLLSNDKVGIENRGQHNSTPLMLAANKGHKELFDFLVSKGCDLSIVDANGNNILHVACLGGNVDICKYLLSNNIVGIESRGQHNRTPVMLAANKGHKELFDFLVSRGCNLLTVDGNGDSILHAACTGGNVDICKYFLSKDIVGIESRGQYNMTPVMVAAIYGHRELFDFLVSKGCDLSVVDGNGDNILHVACIGGNVDICKYLVTKGMTDEMMKKNKLSQTPLQVAESRGHDDVVSILGSFKKGGPREMMRNIFSRKTKT